MSFRSADRPDLSGTLHLLPFLADGLGDRVAPLFADLADEHGVRNVLVLKRFPTETDAIADTFGAAVDGVERPRVVGLSAHASRTLEELPAPPQRLGQAERNLLLATFVDSYEWEDAYLQQASSRESFTFDVARFVTEATWQGGDIETDDPSLAELAVVNDAFHDWLAEADALDAARSLQYAADALADPDVRAQVQESFEAVLALEFEEFTPIDRAYLARLTMHCPLVCVAERHSAIQRTWNEPGPITDHVPGLDVVEASTADSPTLPAAIASFLATGSAAANPDEGAATVIEAETFDEQVAAVAEEIERLHQMGLSYDEMAVVLRDSNAPIPATLRLLRAAGIPVASATVGGLEHDPAARELYALASWCLAAERESPDIDAGWPSARSRSVLDARVPVVTDETLQNVVECRTAEGIAAALDEWLLETDLKHRIATGEDALDAKTQFEHVRTIRSLARAVDRSPVLDSTWATFCFGLEREMQRASSDKIATELDLPGEGVLVDAARVAKNIQRRAVFLLDVVDREYPAEPRFNSLFPTPHLEALEGYPAFTTPDAADVRETFTDETGTGDVVRPLHAYYAALSRRMLAVGARTASERLYFGTYREDTTGTGQNLQPSRFLDAIEDAFGTLDRLEHDEIHTHGEAVRFSLDRVDEALEAVRRAGLVRDPVDLDAVATDFAAIQRVLEEDPPETLRTAITARVDFAEGVVRRE